MKRREFIATTGMGASILMLPAILNIGCGSKFKKPNILFIFTDDQRYDTIHALNNPEVITPNMDRLVKNGISFTRAHIMGGTSGAVCMPSRAMLLTGRTLFHLVDQGAVIPKEHTMLPEILRQNRYQTFATGKWHNGRDAYARCFTAGGKIMFGGMSNHLKVPLYDFDPTGLYPKEKQYIGDKFSSELFSDQAIDFLKNYDSEDPFFIYISYTAPHDPRMAPEEFLKMYDPEKITLPANFMPVHPFDNGEMWIRDENLAPWPRTPEIIKEQIAAYYAMITHVDFHIGRVLTALEKSGRADNTIIVFSGDNGLAVGQHGLMGKQNLYDHSVRVPLIFCGPGIPKNVQSNTLCYLLDIYPTLCGLSKIPIPDTVEGKSLLPAIKNQSVKIRDSVFLAYTKIQRAVRRDDNWKLIKYNVKGVETTQLFNLNDDPWEINNLAEDSNCHNQVVDLTNLLISYMKNLDDFCDLNKPNWGLPEEKHALTKLNHIAKNKKIQFINTVKPKYTTIGIKSLVDGIRASTNFNDGHWLGLQGEDLDVLIDLGKATRMHSISVGFLEDQKSWIFLPLSVEILTSSDGKEFTNQKKLKYMTEKSPQMVIIKDFKATFEGVSSRYLRIRAKNIGQCPPWHPGAGNPAWMFADEIMVFDNS